MNELIKKLEVRVERFKKLQEANAPQLVLINELGLIKKACDELAKELEKENK